MASIFSSSAAGGGIAAAGRLRAALPGEGTGLLWDSDLPAFQTIVPLAGQVTTLPDFWAELQLGLTAPWPDAALPLPTGVIAVLGIEIPAWTQPTGIAEAWPAISVPAVAPPMPTGAAPAVPPRSPELPAPLFPAPALEGGARLDITVAEDTDGVVHRPAVTDRAPDGLGWRITGGADAALLMMDPASGALSFRSLPDFEQPADADGDNAYEVVFEVRDGWGATAMQRLTLSVTDQPEAAPAPDDIWV